MTKTEEIFIKDPDHKSELKLFNVQGFVYLRPNGEPAKQSKKIHLLDKIKVMSISKERADDLSLEYLDKKYPNYNGFIKLT
jgi:hypothetical protein